VSESASTCFRHGLRHSGITIAVEQSTAVGLSLDKVRAYSRHRSINTPLTVTSTTAIATGISGRWRTSWPPPWTLKAVEFTQPAS